MTFFRRNAYTRGIQASCKDPGSVGDYFNESPTDADTCVDLPMMSPSAAILCTRMSKPTARCRLHEPSRAAASVDRAGRSGRNGLHPRRAGAKAQIAPAIRGPEVERQLRCDGLKRRVRVRRRASHVHDVDAKAETGGTEVEEINVAADVEAETSCRDGELITEVGIQPGAGGNAAWSRPAHRRRMDQAGRASDSAPRPAIP